MGLTPTRMQSEGLPSPIASPPNVGGRGKPRLTEREGLIAIEWHVMVAAAKMTTAAGGLALAWPRHA